MSTTTTQPSPVPATGRADEAAVRKAISSIDRPPRASALDAALAFGWRGMLKVKHVPEQLLDVTITPIMFVVMFTYLSAARSRAPPASTSTTSSPGSSSCRSCSRRSTPAWR